MKKVEQNEKYHLDKSKIISNVIVGTLTVVSSAIIIMCLWTVAEPRLSGGNVSTSENAKYMARLEEAFNKIKAKYIDIDEVNLDEMIDGAIEGMSSSTGDPYTRFVSDEEFNDIATSGTETYGGIGVHLTFDKDANAIMVLGVMPNSPALECDIKSGDLIVQVEDIIVNKENYQQCVDNMKGEQGTNVKLYIKRKEEIIEKTVTRKIINNSNVDSEVLEDNIGRIKIWAFENKVYEQFKAEYEKLLTNNVSGIIIDVRNNPGGMVKETIDILDLLLPEGDVLKLVYNDGREKVYKCKNNNQINIPLVVLANERSASAAEILSSAIKDSGKGVLIGDKTYGKGIVQEVEKLGERGALSITVAKYYTMSGVEIHKNGIEPNISISLPEEFKNDIAVPMDKDVQLQKAIEYINSNKK